MFSSVHAMLYARFYYIPISMHFVIIVVFPFIWRKMNDMLMSKKIWMVVNETLFYFSVLFIISITLFLRNTGKSEINIELFNGMFINGTFDKNKLRVIVLNILLFVPVGLTLPIALNKNKRKNEIVIWCFPIMLSLVIEILQYFLSRGVFEIDDIICNTIGALWAIACVKKGEKHDLH